MLRKLPLDLSTFRIMRESNYLYVDKTRHAYNLITQGRRYFLSRPRRFGKSLLVSTLKEILKGNRALCHGLWIDESDYAWKEHGVIALDFSQYNIKDQASFNKGICRALSRIAQEYQLNISVDCEDASFALLEVVEALYERYHHVAILIDEYDNPILHALKKIDRARDIRDEMQQFFRTLKGLDEKINFIFITGVTSFAKAGLFSGMNNLRVISLDERFADICGYTDAEIDTYFSGYIREWADKEKLPYDDLRSQIRSWYNGYHFGVQTASVYNPFSCMYALEQKTFANFWFQSGTPTFLVEELQKEYHKNGETIFNLDKFSLTEDALGIFDVGATPIPSLMFQTGYLTITGYDKNTELYQLGYPDYEVKTALQKHILGIFTKFDIITTDTIAVKIREALTSKNIEELVFLLKQLITKVPYQIHMKQEAFYHALLQVIFGAAGINAQSEYSISHGRIDLVLNLTALIYVIEVKFNQSPEIALKQIEERKYYEVFLDRKKQIILVGLDFKREPNNFEIAAVSKILE